MNIEEIVKFNEMYQKGPFKMEDIRKFHKTAKIVINWNKNPVNAEKFSKKEFLDTHPGLYEICQWNEMVLGERITKSDLLTINMKLSIRTIKSLNNQGFNITREEAIKMISLKDDDGNEIAFNNELLKVPKFPVGYRLDYDEYYILMDKIYDITYILSLE